MNKANLKPCPFCGGTALLETNMNMVYWVSCSCCKASCLEHQQRAIVLRRWNRRTDGGAAKAAPVKLKP